MRPYPSAAPEHTPSQRRALVTRLGNRVMDEINRVTAVTPGSLTALALLSQTNYQATGAGGPAFHKLGKNELAAPAEQLVAATAWLPAPLRIQREETALAIAAE